MRKGEARGERTRLAGLSRRRIARRSEESTLANAVPHCVTRTAFNEPMQGSPVGGRAGEGLDSHPPGVDAGLGRAYARGCRSSVVQGFARGAREGGRMQGGSHTRGKGVAGIPRSTSVPLGNSRHGDGLDSPVADRSQGLSLFRSPPFPL
jgi:hypothetical protein